MCEHVAEQIIILYIDVKQDSFRQQFGLPVNVKCVPLTENVTCDIGFNSD